MRKLILIVFLALSVSGFSAPAIRFGEFWNTWRYDTVQNVWTTIKPLHGMPSTSDPYSVRDSTNGKLKLNKVGRWMINFTPAYYRVDINGYFQAQVRIAKYINGATTYTSSRVFRIRADSTLKNASSCLGYVVRTETVNDYVYFQEYISNAVDRHPASDTKAPGYTAIYLGE